MGKSFKKLFLSVLSLCISLILFGTVVFAWLSINTTSILHNISIGIATGDDFEISLDGINYKKEILNEDFQKYLTKLALIDVTSSDGINFYKGGPSNQKIAIANVDYLKISIYFRTTAKPTADPKTVLRHVFLVDNVSSEAYLNKDIDGTYIISKGINWQADITFLNGLDPINDIIYVGERRVVYAAEAIRLSFQEKPLTGTSDERKEDALASKIFDLSRHPERGYGVSFGSLDYYNKKHGKNIKAPAEPQNVITTLTKFNETDPRFPNDYNSLIASMIKTDKYNEQGDVYYEAKVDMMLWLEGWDADCFNAIHYDKITMKLKFRVGREILN